MSVSVEIDDREAREELARWQNPELRKKLNRATAAGAKALKPHVKAEASKVSKRLARATSAGQAKRDKPAGIVKFRPKIAFFRHWIIGGTRAHGPRRAPLLRFVPGWNPYMSSSRPAGPWIRTTRVAGVKPNPIIARVADAHEDDARRAVERALEES